MNILGYYFSMKTPKLTVCTGLDFLPCNFSTLATQQYQYIEKYGEDHPWWPSHILVVTTDAK